MTAVTLVDTRPLVALCAQRHGYHDWTNMAEVILAPPMMTLDREFLLRRRHGRPVIPLLAPFI